MIDNVSISSITADVASSDPSTILSSQDQENKADDTESIKAENVNEENIESDKDKETEEKVATPAMNENIDIAPDIENENEAKKDDEIENKEEIRDMMNESRVIETAQTEKMMNMILMKTDYILLIDLHSVQKDI